MKILTKEEEAAHYNATVRGGLIGGGLGLVIVSFNFKYLVSTFPHPLSGLLQTGD
jgi:hypothetical protein